MDSVPDEDQRSFEELIRQILGKNHPSPRLISLL